MTTLTFRLSLFVFFCLTILPGCGPSSEWENSVIQGSDLYITSTVSGNFLNLNKQSGYNLKDLQEKYPRYKVTAQMLALRKKRDSVFVCLDEMIRTFESDAYGKCNRVALTLNRPDQPGLARKFWFEPDRKIHCARDGQNNAEIFRDCIWSFFTYMKDDLIDSELKNRPTFSYPHWYETPALNGSVPHSPYKDMSFDEMVFDRITLSRSMQLCQTMKLHLLSWEIYWQGQAFRYLLFSPEPEILKVPDPA